MDSKNTGVSVKQGGQMHKHGMKFDWLNRFLEMDFIGQNKTNKGNKKRHQMRKKKKRKSENFIGVNSRKKRLQPNVNHREI